jgi:hypothetical protein
LIFSLFGYFFFRVKNVTLCFCSVFEEDLLFSERSIQKKNSFVFLFLRDRYLKQKSEKDDLKKKKKVRKLKRSSFVLF